MMYLGWYGKRNCASVNVTEDPVTEAPCNAGWFWFGAVAIAALAIFKDKKGPAATA